MNDTVKKLNDAPVLDQIEGQWMKFVALLLHRFVPPGKSVTITAQDMLKLNSDWPEGAIVSVTGAHDRFIFKLVSPSEAERIAAHQKSQQGRS